MFDDPKKELTDLEAALHALDQKDEDFEDFYAQILDEYGDKTPVVEDVTEAPLTAPHLQDVQSADSAYADKKKAAPEKKDNSVRNLSIIVIIELLGIAAVAAFWFWRML